MSSSGVSSGASRIHAPLEDHRSGLRRTEALAGVHQGVRASARKDEHRAAPCFIIPGPQVVSNFAIFEDLVTTLESLGMKARSHCHLNRIRREYHSAVHSRSACPSHDGYVNLDVRGTRTAHAL